MNRNLELLNPEIMGDEITMNELFRHLRDSGRLFDDDGQWRPGFEIGDTEVPQGVRLVIGRRLDLLGPELSPEVIDRIAAASAASRGFPTAATMNFMSRADPARYA